MLSEYRAEFTKENIDEYLKETAKAYRKQIGKRIPVEMVLVGGASVTSVDIAAKLTAGQTLAKSLECSHWAHRYMK